jgi:lipopolysaccharide export system permease protein
MKLLDRYLLRQFLATYLLLLFGVPVLFMITDVTEQLDGYLARGIPMQQVALSYVYYIPQLLFWAFPIAALIATVFTIGNMTRHQEITAAKAGGVSFYRLAAPVVLLASVLSAGAIALGEVVPVANQLRAETLGERVRTHSVFRLNFVFRTENGRTISAARMNADIGELTQVVMERNSADGPRVQHSANRAIWSPASGWTLEDGYVRWLDPDGTEETFHFLMLSLPDIQERPEELLIVPKDPDEMRYAELERFINTIERAGGNANEYRVNLAQKVSLPLAVLVIVLFGAPLATSSRRGGAAYGIGISLAVTMIYLMLFKVGEAIGTSGAMDPVVAAWMPNGIFFAAAVVLLLRVRT